MKSENLEVSVSWENDSWVIREVGYEEGPGIKVDALIIRAKRSTDSSITGAIVSVYGLSQEIAAVLTSKELKMLGVGSQCSHALGRERLTYLMCGGKVQREVVSV